MTHNPTRAFAHSSGPVPCRVAFVAEAWGASEDLFKRPLVGATGRELLSILRDADWPDLTSTPSTPSELDMLNFWAAQKIFITNTFTFRPQNNKILSICGSKKDVAKNCTKGPIYLGKYLLPEYLPELDRLKEELEVVKPNVVVAFGAIASWALINSNTITSVRGTIAESTLIKGLKVLPTFHPASIFRQWSNRPVIIADLIKAKKEMEHSKIFRPERQILVNPTLKDIFDFVCLVSVNFPDSLMAIDIETSCKTITCISFSVSPDYALVIPFHEPSKPAGNYWNSKEEELKAWKLVRELLERQNPKLFQNGLYDLQYLCRMGFKVNNVLHDTMLLHHALYPEMEKSLGFLGSLYTNESSWKLMRKRRGKDFIKAEE